MDKDRGRKKEGARIMERGRGRGRGRGRESLLSRVDVVNHYRSLLQNIVSFIGLFCKRDLYL